MGGSSKGKKRTENTTQTTMPPAWALPLFERHANDTMALYNSGEGGNVYQGERIAELGEGTKKAVDDLRKTADNFNAGNLQDIAKSPTESAQNLADMASGKYLKEGNPFYKERLNDEINDMASMVNSKLSGAGRLNSGANTDILAKNTSRMLLQGLESDYDRAMQNMLKGNSAIDQANRDKLTSAGNFFNDQSNANNNALTGQSLVDKNNQEKLSADWSKWQEEDNQGWNRLGLLQEAMKDSALNYGTTNNTRKTAQSNNPFAAAGGFMAKLINK